MNSVRAPPANGPTESLKVVCTKCNCILQYNHVDVWVSIAYVKEIVLLNSQLQTRLLLHINNILVYLKVTIFCRYYCLWIVGFAHFTGIIFCYLIGGAALIIIHEFNCPFVQIRRNIKTLVSAKKHQNCYLLCTVWNAKHFVLPVVLV